MSAVVRYPLRFNFVTIEGFRGKVAVGRWDMIPICQLVDKQLCGAICCEHHAKIGDVRTREKERQSKKTSSKDQPSSHHHHNITIEETLITNNTLHHNVVVGVTG